MRKEKQWFSAPRYATRQVAEHVGLELQLALWAAVDQRAEQSEELDFLQVFVLTIEWVDGEPLQKVRNRQEQPLKEVTFYVNGVDKPLDGVTLWALDSQVYSTLLFPEEY